MRAVKSAAKELLGTAVGWRLARPLRQPRCLVLAYHRIAEPGVPFTHVTVDAFRAQMAWLRRHCTVLDPAALRGAVDIRGGRPPVLITFDDGYKDYFDLAYPVLREFDIPAVNFLSTQFVDQGGLFWWDALSLAVQASPRARVEIPWAPDRTYDLTADGRRVVRRLFSTRIANAPDDERAALLQEFSETMGVDVGALDAPRQVMTWDEVRASMDLTTYGGHTHTHVRVSRVDETVLDWEIRTCRDRMEAETGIRPTLFAYPIGDGSPTARRLLRRYGFDTAFSIIEGYVEGDVDWLDIRRFPGPSTVGELAWLAAGWGRQQAAPAPPPTPRAART